MNEKWAARHVELWGDHYLATIYSGGNARMCFPGSREDGRWITFEDVAAIDALIERLRELKSLAEEHFGEDWGR